MKLLSYLGMLPKPWLTALASLLSTMLNLAGGYRGKVVRGNLERAFPSMTSAERRRLARQFQRRFAQLLVESAKLFRMSESGLLEGMVHHNRQVVQRLHDEGKHVLVAGGHMNNWEWSALTLNQNVPHRTMALYKELSNPSAERLMTASRSRFGLEMVKTKEGRDWMDQEATKGEPMAVIMGFDQCPSNPRKSWWTTFLGLETPVHYGLEQWARRYDMAVVYASIRHEGPWRYSLHYEVIAEDVSDLAEGVILDRCLTALEREIHADPARWLWSHKRWKHRRPEGEPLHPRTHESVSQ